MLQAFCAILLLFAFQALAPAAHADGFAERFKTATHPAPLPAFLFADDTGQRQALSDFRGRYVLLNLWATWCAPCAKEMPSLDALQGKFDPGRLTVIALNENSGGAAVIEDFYRRYGIERLKVYSDVTGHVPVLLGAEGLPTTFLIGPGGNEIGRVDGGANWNGPEALAVLEARTGLSSATSATR